MSGEILDRPSGEQLYQELVAEAKRRKIAVVHLGRKLWPYGPGWKLEQLRIARSPTPGTVERVRAVIAGDAVEPQFEPALDSGTGPAAKIPRDRRRQLGLPPSRREHKENRLLERQLEIRQQLADRINVCRLAHDARLPGETLHAAAARLERERRA